MICWYGIKKIWFLSNAKIFHFSISGFVEENNGLNAMRHINEPVKNESCCLSDESGPAGS